MANGDLTLGLYGPDRRARRWAICARTSDHSSSSAVPASISSLRRPISSSQAFSISLLANRSAGWRPATHEVLALLGRKLQSRFKDAAALPRTTCSQYTSLRGGGPRRRSNRRAPDPPPLSRWPSEATSSARPRARELPPAPSAGPPGLQAAGRRSRRPGPVVDAEPPCPKGRGGPVARRATQSAPSRAPLPPGDSLWSERSERQGGARGGGSRGEGRGGGSGGQGLLPGGPASAQSATPAPTGAPPRSPRRVPIAEASLFSAAEWRGRCAERARVRDRLPQIGSRERRCTGRDTDDRALPPLFGSTRAPSRR